MTKILGAVLATIVLVLFVAAGIWGIRYYTAETRGVITAEEQIESAGSRITSYEHFYDLCATVQTREDALGAQEAQLEGAESQDERQRIRANIAGLQAQRNRAIHQYNADARKSYTQARFLGDDLPRKLSADQEVTSC